MRSISLTNLTLWIREESRELNSIGPHLIRLTSNLHAESQSQLKFHFSSAEATSIPLRISSSAAATKAKYQMAASVATMAMLNAKCRSISSTKMINPTKPTTKPISLLSMQNLPKGLTISKPSDNSNLPSSLAGTAIAGAIFSTLSSCDPAFAAQQIAEIAEGDNRGLALLLPIIPAIAWVLFNILQPALNQLNRMRSKKGVIIGLGLGGLAASGFMSTPEASASEIAMIADAASSDNRGTLLLFVLAPALLWVAYNILQPALNQLNRMR